MKNVNKINKKKFDKLEKVVYGARKADTKNRLIDLLDKTTENPL